MATDEISLLQRFEACQQTISDLENGKSDQERLQNTVEELHKLEKDIEKLSMFSSNEDFTELPSNSLQLLLVSAYLGYIAENITGDPDKRPTYLKAARAYYRTYLEKLLAYNVIAFKLPWLDDEGLDDEGQVIEEKETTELPKIDHSIRRQQKIQRIQTLKKLEEALAQLKKERERNDDEATLREFTVVLLRSWALKAMTELEAIAEELPLAEHFIKVQLGQAIHKPSAPQKSSLPPFIIAKTEEQRKVFGLGYPSIPTYTVDQWYDQMQQKGRFGKVDKLQTVHIDGTKEDDVVEKYDDGEDESEEGRQKKIQWDEYKDWHRRGYGNTHNKG
uniref:Immunoglobulin-binding protein 1 n=1 Tax=Panagrolaimus davidi TaxID=227884 RepID=A0A914PXQ8_9BILA